MTDTFELAKKCGAEHKEMLFGPGDGFIFTESELESFRAECVKEAQQWQPIETAPDGQWVIACDSSGDISIDMRGEDGWHGFGIRYWMPLPPAPNATGKE